MKCIEYADGRAVRIANETAEEKVRSGEAAYISKSAWRDRDGGFEGPQTSKGKVSIHPHKHWVNRSNGKPRWAR